MKTKPHENPLIPHARMRGLYRALVEARLLGKRNAGWPRNFEACWAATALDLREGDLTSDSQAPWLTTHVRALGQRKDARAATISDIKRANKNAKFAALLQSSVGDRLFIAIGQAIALKAAGDGVVLAYTAADRMKKSDWHRLAAAAEGQNLPLVIVATPGARDTHLPNLSVPVIPVDAGDPIALYRVAQESIVRARTDGGIAIIECVDCGVDPIQLLAAQLLHKGICTERWLAGVEPAFRNLLAST